MSLLPGMLPRDKQTGASLRECTWMDVYAGTPQPYGQPTVLQVQVAQSTYGISGFGFINITAESAFWMNGLWRRAFYVRRSLKSLTDEILLLYVSPKSNCPRKMAQNSRLWCRRELWIKTLQSRFCCPRIQHDALPHRPASNKVARPPVLTKHLLEPRSTFYVRLFHITSSYKTSFQLTPISHKIVGVNNKCSKDNRLVTA